MTTNYPVYSVYTRRNGVGLPIPELVELIQEHAGGPESCVGPVRMMYVWNREIKKIVETDSAIAVMSDDVYELLEQKAATAPEDGGFDFEFKIKPYHFPKFDDWTGQNPGIRVTLPEQLTAKECEEQIVAKLEAFYHLMNIGRVRVIIPRTSQGSSAHKRVGIISFERGFDVQTVAYIKVILSDADWEGVEDPKTKGRQGGPFALRMLVFWDEYYAEFEKRREERQTQKKTAVPYEERTSRRAPVVVKPKSSVTLIGKSTSKPNQKSPIKTPPNSTSSSQGSQGSSGAQGSSSSASSTFPKKGKETANKKITFEGTFDQFMKEVTKESTGESNGVNGTPLSDSQKELAAMVPATAAPIKAIPAKAVESPSSIPSSSSSNSSNGTSSTTLGGKETKTKWVRPPKKTIGDATIVPPVVPIPTPSSTLDPVPSNVSNPTSSSSSSGTGITFVSVVNSSVSASASAPVTSVPATVSVQ